MRVEEIIDTGSTRGDDDQNLKPVASLRLEKHRDNPETGTRYW